MNELDMESKNIVNENIQKISELFPNVIVESDTGKTIDFELLKQELNEDIVEGVKEKYQLTWPGKKEAIVNANTPSKNTLRPVKEKSVNFDTTQNIYIEGDNLEVLKILQESYLNKIKCIYIDPPYNTGNDFIYNDKFKKDIDEELLESGQVDEKGNRMVTNNQSNGRFHSDWLSMMYPRLKLARNLLTDDGVIFISIDENEADNIKKICDEIFSPENYRNQLLVRRRNKSLNLQFAENGLKTFNVGCEYIYVYSKSNKFLFNPLRMKKNNISDKGSWNVFWSNADRPTMRYELLGFTPESGQWRWKKELAEEAINNYNKYLEEFSSKISLEDYWEKTGKKLKFIRKIKNGKGKNGGIQYWVGPDKTSLRTSNWTDIEVSQIAKDFELPFENPKNVELIKLIISSIKEKNFCVLDFFSGSATSADAVMRLNSEDNGNRKYIMVQLAEKCEENSEAYRNGYKTICEIGEERIRRAGAKIKEEINANIDYGFRVYKVDSTNMKEVYYMPNDLEQVNLSEFESNIKEDRTTDDLLTQVILDLGLSLDLNIEEKMIGKNKVYYVAGNSLVACFDDKIDIDIVDKICECEPYKVVFKDSAFKTDNDKINLEERFKKLLPQRANDKGFINIL